MLLAVLPYANSLRNSFVYDDIQQVLENPYIRNFHHLREIFTTNVWSFVGDYRGKSNYYRPLMMLGYTLCYQIFGPRAYGFHLANLLFFSATVCALFLITRRLFHSEGVAFLTAGLFALHPIHTEPVNWIGAITELELGFFYMLSFWFFLRLPRSSGRWSSGAAVGMLSSFAVALLSKEQALTVPALATVYEHFYRDDRTQTNWVQKVSRYGALWVLVAAYILARVKIMGSLAAQVVRPWSGGEILIAAFALVGQYAAKLLWPVRLCMFYVFPDDVGALFPRAEAGFVVVALGVLLFVFLWKRYRLLSFPLIWFVMTLAPVLNARWMATSAFNERYAYLPSVGFCWLLAWAGVEMWRWARARPPVWRGTLVALGALLALLCGVRIVTRNRDWRNDVALYASTLRFSPDAYDMHDNLGTAYWDQGNDTAAEEEWNRALALHPDDPLVLHNLGLVAKNKKSYEDAVGRFLQALQIKPNYADAHLDLGLTYGQMGLGGQAEEHLRAAVTLSPLTPRARNSLGEFYFDQHRLGEAEEQFQKSLESRPNREGYWDLGFVCWAKGDLAGAERAFKSAEELLPYGSRVHFILGSFYAATGKSSEAIREYQAGLKFDPSNSEALAALKQLTP